MPYAWDNGYAYAKAACILGKSFLGKRISLLSGLRSLGELDRLVFAGNQKDLPGRELLADMEKRIADRAARRILSVVNSHSCPKLLVQMLKSIKQRTDILKTSTDSMTLINELDFNFYSGLIESLSELTGEDREAAASLIGDEISLRNCVWALRLRTYYQKNETETAKYLMKLKLSSTNKVFSMYQRRSSLDCEARASLTFPLDVRLPWRGWRWEKFLNSEELSAHWTCDPRFFQNAASRYVYRLAYRCFHSLPVSVSAVYSFIKLIQFEEDILTSIAEGLSLGMDSSNIFKLLEIN